MSSQRKVHSVDFSHHDEESKDTPKLKGGAERRKLKAGTASSFVRGFAQRKSGVPDT
jgi:hypothetical protein